MNTMNSITPYINLVINDFRYFREVPVTFQLIDAIQNGEYSISESCKAEAKIWGIRREILSQLAGNSSLTDRLIDYAKQVFADDRIFLYEIERTRDYLRLQKVVSSERLETVVEYTKSDEYQALPCEKKVEVENLKSTLVDKSIDKTNKDIKEGIRNSVLMALFTVACFYVAEWFDKISVSGGDLFDHIAEWFGLFCLYGGFMTVVFVFTSVSEYIKENQKVNQIKGRTNPDFLTDVTIYVPNKPSSAVSPLVNKPIQSESDAQVKKSPSDPVFGLIDKVIGKIIDKIMP